MKNLTPDNWPAGAPEYWSSEGYEFQKLTARKALIAEVNTIPWLLKAAELSRTTDQLKTEQYLCVAARLADIVSHPLRAVIQRLYETTQAINSSRARIALVSSRCGDKPDLAKNLYNN